MTKYTDYRIILTKPDCLVKFNIVQGKKIIIPEINPKWSFFIDKNKSITNIETGFRCGVQSYFMDKIPMMEKMLEERLEYFGNVKDIPENGIQYTKWYTVYGNKFRKIFGFDIPVDVSGLNIIRFDSIIRPNDGESTYQAIERLYSIEVVDFIEEIINHPPFCQWFWRENRE